MKTKNKQTLSFFVKEIRTRMDGSVTYYETDLYFYNSQQIITIRGKPYRIGTKVDFIQT